MGKVIRLSADAQQHLTAWRTSGLTQAAYCAARGLKVTTFNTWVRSERATMAGPFPPLTLIAARPEALPPQPAEPWRLRHASGWTLELPANLAPTDLVALLRQLA